MIRKERPEEQARRQKVGGRGEGERVKKQALQPLGNCLEYRHTNTHSEKVGERQMEVSTAASHADASVERGVGRGRVSEGQSTRHRESEEKGSGEEGEGRKGRGV